MLLTLGYVPNCRYYTLASPRALFCVQLLGALLGVVVSPGCVIAYPFQLIPQQLASLACRPVCKLTWWCLARTGSGLDAQAT